jgi:hypothetical protein
MVTTCPLRQPLLLSITSMQNKLIFIALLIFTASSSCRKESDDKPSGSLQLYSVKGGNIAFDLQGTTSQIPLTSSFELLFSAAVNPTSASDEVRIIKSGIAIATSVSLSENGRGVTLTPLNALEYSSDYIISISSKLRGASNETFPGIDISFQTVAPSIHISSITANGQNFSIPMHPKGISFEQALINVTFNEPVLAQNIGQYFSFSPSVQFTATLSNDRKTVEIATTVPLDYYRKYFLVISPSLQSENGAIFGGFSNYFITGLNPEIKMPIIDDEALLNLVQEHTFRYFWDFAHPVSGLARERNSSGNLVTIGGSGFGLMGIIIGVERGFISRHQAVERFEKITAFLAIADRFHGAWPHWLDGNTGRVLAFSNFDDGADLVETAFLAAALIAVRQYLNPAFVEEQQIIERINQMLDEIEWDWFTRDGQQLLYWHWSPNHGWAMNMHISGYNEAMIVYFLAAASQTHAIEPSVYHQGWARNGAIVNGQSYHNIQLPLGFPYGGPLFFAHYSFLGLDPRNLSDSYANYWTQNLNHTLINRQHCIVNPNGHLGYGPDCWGLTASDDHSGYGVHEPSRDNGTISPTAALSSMPYTPEESMQALRHFYYVLGDKLWGQYGFYDAFNPGEGWFANSYLAIDQGPILIMIENHRTGLIWDLFMTAPEVQLAMNRLGFSR